MRAVARSAPELDVVRVPRDVLHVERVGDDLGAHGGRALAAVVVAEDAAGVRPLLAARGAHHHPVHREAREQLEAVQQRRQTRLAALAGARQAEHTLARQKRILNV